MLLVDVVDGVEETGIRTRVNDSECRRASGGGPAVRLLMEVLIIGTYRVSGPCTESECEVRIDHTSALLDEEVAMYRSVEMLRWP